MNQQENTPTLTKRKLVFDPVAGKLVPQAEVPNSALENQLKVPIKNLVQGLLPEVIQEFTGKKAAIAQELTKRVTFLHTYRTQLLTPWNTFADKYQTDQATDDDATKLMSEIRGCLQHMSGELTHFSLIEEYQFLINTLLTSIENNDLPDFLEKLSNFLSKIDIFNYEAYLADFESISNIQPNLENSNQTLTAEINLEQVSSSSLSLVLQRLGNQARFKWNLTLQDGQIKFGILDESVQRLHYDDDSGFITSFTPTHLLSQTYKDLLVKQLHLPQ